MAKDRKRKKRRAPTASEAAKLPAAAREPTPGERSALAKGMPWPDGTGATGPRAGMDDLDRAVARIDDATRARAAVADPDAHPGATPVVLQPKVAARSPRAARMVEEADAFVAGMSPDEARKEADAGVVVVPEVESTDAVTAAVGAMPGAIPSPTQFTDPVDGRQIEVDPDRPRTPVRSPSEALDTHLRFRAWLRTEEAAWAYNRLIRSEGVNQINFVGAAADMAETVFVSGDMSRLAAKLAEADGDTIPVLHATDVPAPFGLVILGDPVQLMPPGDNDGPWYDHTRVRGLLWATADTAGMVHTPGLDIELRGVPGDPENDMDDLVGRGGLVVWELYDAGQMLVGKGAFEANGRPPLLPGVTSAMPFETQLAWHDRTSGPRVRRYLGWLLRIMWQRIAPAEPYQPSRAELRRWERAVRGRGRTTPKVMQLRRFTPTPGRDADRPEAGNGRKLGHEIVVRGHPRDQHYSTLGPAYVDGIWNPASHRRIWIAAYPKGPRGDGPPEEKRGVIVVNR